MTIKLITDSLQMLLLHDDGLCTFLQCCEQRCLLAWKSHLCSVPFLGQAMNALGQQLSCKAQAKPGSNVHISNAMPDVETLMQQWPLEIEQQLHSIKLPDATLVSC